MVDLKQMGGNQWRKAKMALGFTTCLYAPRTLERREDDDGGGAAAEQQHLSSGVASKSSSANAPSSSGHRLSKSGPLSKSGKRTCAICLTTMKAGQGHAIFTAECSHSFHFHCITSNVKHGNQVCPVCRAKWKEVPFQSPGSDNPNRRSRTNNVGWPSQPDNEWMNIVRRVPPPRLVTTTSHRASSYHHEPAVFDDDEALGRDQPSEVAERSLARSIMEIETYPEFPAVSRYASHSDFSVLILLKAPPKVVLGSSRAPIDLITVLDISGSMAGTKLALLKRAMGFVIQNLGPSDRLSVVTFSSSARRLFPLRCMTEAGRQEALQAVNSLISNGGTNIAEGLRKGAKLLLDRKWKNPVCSIILLSDGQDTYTVASPGGNRAQPDYKLLLPASIHRNTGSDLRIPVHTFGFGVDHDAAAMHSVAEASGGTFSFIEAERAIQDAFAQCIGGLLSVVVQELQVEIECVNPSLNIRSVNAGSYKTRTSDDARTGSIEVGDLYAEEERDILVTMDIPVDESTNEMSLLTVKCIYRDPITKKDVNLEGSGPVNIQRPEDVGLQAVSIEVDRQRNRLRAAEAMAEARSAAENSELSRAVAVLESCRKALSETASVRAGDRLCNVLCSELREMQERMATRRVYETSGRAYVLSGLSSHSLQRATARGLVQSYQTPTMVDMVTRSQTLMLGNPSPQRKLRPALSFPTRTLEPR
ncbi:E3 ubiquitin-protein ligase WAV3 [Linum perenne]